MVSWHLKNRGLRPIGLDIGHGSIKMIQLLIGNGQMSVWAADETRLDVDANRDERAVRITAVSAIKRMLAKSNFHGKDVVSCLPSGKLKITSVRLAETDAETLEQSIRKEAAQRFGLNPERDAMDYLVAGSVRQGDEVKNELILFATSSETIRDHIEMLEEAGLRPVGIDPIPCALFRSFGRSLRRLEDRERTVVFVDVGSRFTTVVLGSAGQISLVKQIQIGGERFAREVAAKLGVSSGEAEVLRESLRSERYALAMKPDASPSQGTEGRQEVDVSMRDTITDVANSLAEELAREISLCLRYYTVTFRGARVERGIFAGGGAHEDLLMDVLRRQLAVDIEVAEPLRGVDLSSERANLNFRGDRRGLLCEWAVAVGLSLKGWNGTEDSQVSARRGSWANERN
ncbi:MAG: pilus assembly protein PilM [Sedimentisphaerales bacterium]|jgi:type IV pilus assembly protein PilM